MEQVGHSIVIRRALLTNVGRGALAGLLAGLVMMLIAVVLPSSFGFKPMVVKSGSMAPALQAGDIAVVRSVDPGALKLGDVVTYRSGESMVTHRIVSTETTPAGQVFVMQGDANTVVDPVPVASSQLVGIVSYRVPKMGFFIDFAGSAAGRALLIGLPAAALALVAVQRLAKGPRRESVPSPTGHSFGTQGPSGGRKQ